MADTTWGELTDNNIGQTLTFRFPWDEDDTIAVLTSLVGEVKADDDGTPRFRNILDYGGEIGEQVTALRSDLPVTVEDAK
jgi:hypothetical protein